MTSYDIPDHSYPLQTSTTINDSFDTEYVYNMGAKAIPCEAYIPENGNINAQLRTKLQMVRIMQQLDGWCTVSKASILMDLVFIFQPRVIVEIGVWGGKSLIPMALAVKNNSSGKVYGIDPWSATSSIEGQDGENKDWWQAADHNQVYDKLVEQLARCDLNSVVTLIRKESQDAAPIPNIDILHIDGNHSDKTSYEDVRKWLPLVGMGKLVIFDDTTWSSIDRALPLLNEYCIKLAEFKGENTWGIWLKVKEVPTEIE